jgi:glycosyltransferase involved in cell wall biosynthesis
MIINFYTGTVDHQNVIGSGGVQFVLSRITSALSRRGIKINIISCFPGDSPCPFPFDTKIDLFYIQNKLRHNPDSSFFKKFQFWFYIFFKIKFFLKDKNIDYHVSVSPALSIIIILYSFIYRLKVILWENVQFHVYKKLLNIIRLFLFKHAYCVVVVSNDDLVFLKKKGVNALLIFNPNSLEIKNNNLFQPLAFSNNLIAAGRLVWQKGFDMLIDVAYILKSKHKANFKITIVGDGPMKDILFNKVKRLELESFIFFHPFTVDIANIFKRHSVFLLTSRFEGLPVVLLDSQAYGLPCISFNCPTGPSEIIENGVNGYLIDCFNLDNFALKINELISNEDTFYKFSSNSVIKSNSFFLDDIIEKWLFLLKKNDK